MSNIREWPFLRIGHRGAAALEPENTLRGIERALRIGVEMVEIDVRPCADGTLMVVHDDDLHRVTGKHIRVSTSSAATLRSLDMGKGERMPTLEEALSLLRGRALVNLDQKVDNLAPQLLHAIARAGSLEETLLSGAASRTFYAMRTLAPSLPFALSIDVGVRDLPLRMLARLFSAGANGQSARLLGHARAAGTDLLALDWRLASRMVVERLSRAGVYVLTWTVDDLATMRVVRQAGVHGITSNRPDLLMHLT